MSLILRLRSAGRQSRHYRQCSFLPLRALETCIGLYATVEILSYRAITKTKRLPEHKLAISLSRDQNLQFARCRFLSCASVRSKVQMRFAHLLTLHKPFGTQSWMTVTHGCDDS
jgi:hypothetical protein